MDGPKRGSHVLALLAFLLEALGILTYTVNFVKQFVAIFQLLSVVLGLGSHQRRLNVLSVAVNRVRARREPARHSCLRLASEQRLVNLGYLAMTANGAHPH